VRAPKCILFALLPIAVCGCGKNRAIGTWAEDGHTGGGVLLTIRPDKSFTFIVSETGSGAVVSRFDGSYDEAKDGVHLHPTSLHFIGGNLDEAASSFAQPNGELDTIAKSLFQILTSDRASMSFGSATLDLHRLQNSDIAPTMSASEVAFSKKVIEEHQYIVARDNAIKERNQEQQSQRDNGPQPQQYADRYRAPQPDPTAVPPPDNGRPDNSPGATPDPIAPDSASTGDSTPPTTDNGTNNNGTNNNGSTTDSSTPATTGSTRPGDQASSSTTG